MDDLKTLLKKFTDASQALSTIKDYTTDVKKVEAQQKALDDAKKLIEETQALEKKDKATFDGIKPTLDKFKKSYEEGKEVFATAGLARARGNADQIGKNLEKNAKDLGVKFGEGLKDLANTIKTTLAGLYQDLRDAVKPADKNAKDTKATTDKVAADQQKDDDDKEADDKAKKSKSGFLGGLNFKSILGAIVGVLLGFFGGKMFGGGFFGKLAGIGLAVFGAIKGREFAEGHFNGLAGYAKKMIEANDPAQKNTSNAATMPEEKQKEATKSAEKPAANSEQSGLSKEEIEAMLGSYNKGSSKGLAPKDANPADSISPNVNRNRNDSPKLQLQH